MNAEELIRRLSEVPPEAEVFMPVYEYGHVFDREVAAVIQDEYGDVILKPE